MSLLLLVACGPKVLPPPPAEWFEPASVYAIEASDPLDLSVDDVISGATLDGVNPASRRIASLDRLARRLLVAELAGDQPMVVDAEAFAHDAGVPLAVYSFLSMSDRQKFLPYYAYEWAQTAPQDAAMAIGVASLGTRGHTAAVVVLAHLAFELVDPVPRSTDAPTPISVIWDQAGAPEVVSVGPDGLVVTPLVVADGRATGELPAPKQTGIRHDLVAVVTGAGAQDTRLLGHLDQPGPDGVLPLPHPLPEGDDLDARVLAAVRQLRGDLPLERVTLDAPCVGWAKELDGMWLRADQDCWSAPGLDGVEAWNSTAARPWFLESITRGSHDGVHVDTSDGLLLHFVGRFHPLEAAEGAAAIAERLQARWPDAKRMEVGEPEWFQDQVQAYAVAADGGDAVLQAVLDREGLLDVPGNELFVVGTAAEGLDEAAEQVQIDFTPTWYAVAYASARLDETGPFHAVLVIAIR